MSKFDSIKNQSLMVVEAKDDEVVFIFGDNRYLFVTIVGDKLQVDSVPE